MSAMSCTVAVFVAAVDRGPSTDTHWQMHKEGLVVVEEESGYYHYLEDSYY